MALSEKLFENLDLYVNSFPRFSRSVNSRSSSMTACIISSFSAR